MTPIAIILPIAMAVMPAESLLVDETKPPVPTQASSATTVSITEVPQGRLPRREPRKPAAVPGKPDRWVKVPTSTTRIDAKKPFMRVYYWPPSPAGEEPLASNGEKPPILKYGMILDPVNFAYNSSEVLPVSSHLKHIADWLQADRNHAMTLTGYADSRGSRAYNEKLSLRRAHAVRARLIELGAADSRITVRGLGIEKPLRNGKSNEDHWWASRRVEIALHSVDEAPSSAMKPEKSNALPKPDAISATKAEAKP